MKTIPLWFDFGGGRWKFGNSHLDNFCILTMKNVGGIWLPIDSAVDVVVCVAKLTADLRLPTISEIDDRKI